MALNHAVATAYSFRSHPRSRYGEGWPDYILHAVRDIDAWQRKDRVESDFQLISHRVPKHQTSSRG